mmetsp:Transcript_10205/g.16717  ORF Transcript_10205/g.16717 Transcript_10205/m.16717 type:complete len:97 (+) Transcript_10205:1901-2191(+)
MTAEQLEIERHHRLTASALLRLDHSLHRLAPVWNPNSISANERNGDTIVCIFVRATACRTWKFFTWCSLLILAFVTFKSWLQVDKPWNARQQQLAR